MKSLFKFFAQFSIGLSFADEFVFKNIFRMSVLVIQIKADIHVYTYKYIHTCNLLLCGLAFHSLNGVSHFNSNCNTVLFNDFSL